MFPQMLTSKSPDSTKNARKIQELADAVKELSKDAAVLGKRVSISCKLPTEDKTDLLGSVIKTRSS